MTLLTELRAMLGSLGLLTLCAFVLSLEYRSWPLRHARTDIVVRTLGAAVAGLLLALYPVALGSAEFTLRLVPVALIALFYGPLWGTLAALPGLGLVLPAGLPALLATSGVLAGSVATRLLLGPPQGQLGVVAPAWWRWWAAPLSLSAGLLDLLPVGRGALSAVPAALLFLLVSYWTMMLVLTSRVRLLRSTTALRREAYSDPLTGLRNRRQFDQDLHALGRGDLVALLDIDLFKEVNDTLGHAEGDRVLREVAAALTRGVRGDDHVYRVGGEEFALLLRCLDLEQGAAVVRRSLEQVREVQVQGQPVTLSGGLAVHDEQEVPSRTVARADAALYRAKQAGRDRLMLAGRQPHPHAPDDQGEFTARSALALINGDRDPTRQQWNEVLRAVVGGVPGAEAGSLYMVDAGGDFVVCAQHGFADTLLDVRRSPASMQRWYAWPVPAWQAGHPRILRGPEVMAAAAVATTLETHLTGREHESLMKPVEAISATLGVPVVVDGQVSAFLNLDRLSGADGFPDGSPGVAREAAGQLGAVLFTRLRRERAARHVRELEALARVTEALRDTRRKDEVLNVVMTMTHELLGAREIVFLAYESGPDVLTSTTTSGVSPGQGQVTLQRGQGLAWEAVRTGDILRVADVRTATRIHRPSFLQGGALLAAPLQREHNLLGVLVLTRDTPFQEWDTHLVRTLAAHFLTALDRAEQLRALEEAREGTLLALGLTLEARDMETHGHTARVTQLAQRMADALSLSDPDRSALRDVAYLHDIGKVQVPDDLLRKPGPLTPEERRVVEQHAPAGEALARHIPGVGRATLDVVRHHHERWDGAGYPDRLAGRRIPRLARLFALCDVFDALTTDRPYRPAWSAEQALAFLADQAGQQFDPELTGVFLTLMRDGEAAAPSMDA
ncbi:diguanylate cyclase (plasmid) [Deinococcus taeanensis]|uniref:HD domain-containing phosphohydrolase n=1 Tax=Deinococcus taeanensis TaxID=2737050 RepID=UPI001CDB61B1|nr:HD domain-containing phosphohydrolase [Deinococcus taeanensis]UBV44838.1 diguanylate cyclase [Deinococcus taeanensis]